MHGAGCGNDPGRRNIHFRGANPPMLSSGVKNRGSMGTKKIQTVCGYSCTGCDHYTRECRGCEPTKGKPFWTVYVGADCCPVYDCCVNERKLPHCGKCPDLMCERFTRFKDPDMTDEQAAECLATMERELKRRK